MKTFVDACLANPEIEADIEEWIAAWHKRKVRGVPLHEHLGMTWRDYSRWLRDPSALGGIVEEARRRASAIAKRR